MKAVFSVGGDTGAGFMNEPSYDIEISFNGQPGKVVLAVNRIKFQGFSGSGDNPVTTEKKETEMVCRTVLEASHARAISSALLSAATEARS